MAARIVVVLGAQRVEEMPLGVEHGQVVESGLLQYGGCVAELERARAVELPAGHGVHLVPEAQVL